MSRNSPSPSTSAQPPPGRKPLTIWLVLFWAFLGVHLRVVASNCIDGVALHGCFCGLLFSLSDVSRAGVLPGQAG